MIEAITNEVAIPQKKYIGADELLAREITEVPMLIDNLFQKVGVAALVGSSDTGKSTLLRQLAIDVVTSDNFLGFPINSTHQKAIYVSSEDDENGVASLLTKYNKEQHLPYSSFEGLRFVFETENILSTLDMMITEQSTDIVVIDAFGDLFSGQMNDGNRVRQFLNAYSQLAQKHQCLIVFLHHCGKRTEDLPPNKGSVVGSQSFEAKMRLVIELRIDFKDPKLRHLCITKGNYLPQNKKHSSYVLEFNENMMFKNTGKQVAFELLGKPQEAKGRKDEKCREIIELMDKGYSQNEAADKVGISKGQASKILKTYKNNHQTDDEENDNEIDEDETVSCFQALSGSETETLAA